MQLSPQVQFSAQLQLGEHASQAPTLEPAAHAQLQPGPQSQVEAQPHEFSEHFGHVMIATLRRSKHDYRQLQSNQQGRLWRDCRQAS